MTEDELDKKSAQLRTHIRKNQKLARPYNIAVRQAKKELAKITAEANRAERELKKKLKQEERAKFEATPQKLCAFTKTFTSKTSDETETKRCHVWTRFGEYCSMHASGMAICASNECIKTRNDQSSYCNKHDPKAKKRPNFAYSPRDHINAFDFDEDDEYVDYDFIIEEPFGESKQEPREAKRQLSRLVGVSRFCQNPKCHTYVQPAKGEKYCAACLHYGRMIETK